MVDFKKLVGKRVPVEATDPLRLFDSLDRKGSHATLRPAQVAALTALRDRRADLDLVLKMPTGMGKSTVALLYLKSHMAESRRPGVYLCPTNQLVRQVIAEASKVGIDAYAYVGGESHPHPECSAGKAVIVCNYAKLFNGRTTFDRPDVSITPSALVLDDAHAGIEAVRDAFTLRCIDSELVEPLMKLLSGACRTYAPGAWEEIELGRPDETIEIPFWLWAPLVEPVRDFFARHSEHDQVMFAWPNLREHLRWCRCVIAADGIEIVPHVIPVRRVRPYRTAEHRLFMSGTLADESILVRDLDCAVRAASEPIIAGVDVGLGERMVLAPTLLDRNLGRTWVMKLCRRVARRVRVVALCSSERFARDWTAVGATVVTGDAVTEVVDQVRSGDIQFVALAQRYDGIDLPDDACRVLVLDGMPYGQGIVDKHDSLRTRTVGGIRDRLVFRIEQGMGRAVRSPADYAVVILAGPELASFTAKTEVRNLMSSDARVQLELAHELASLAASEVHTTPARALMDMLNKCLGRDAGWKAFYDERVRKAVPSPLRRATTSSIQQAHAEQVAAGRAAEGDIRGACETLSEAIATYVEVDAVKAHYLQQKANYTYESDEGEALEIQHQAFGADKSVLRPPKGVVVHPPKASTIKTPARILKWYGEFTHPNGAIAAYQATRAELAFSSTPATFEQALRDFASFVGAEGFRPERELGGGPDNLLLWAEVSLVVEVKNGASYDAIPKRDAAQLHHSVEWFKESYPSRVPTPVMVVNAQRVSNQVVLPAGTRILMPDGLERLLDAVEKFVEALVTRSPSAWSEKEMAKLLLHHRVTPEQIVGGYTVPVK